MVEYDADIESVVRQTTRERDDGDGADAEAVLARVVGETNALHRQVLDTIDDLKRRGELYEPQTNRLRVTDDVQSEDGTPVETLQDPDVPSGTLRTVRGAVEAQSGGYDGGARRAQIDDVLPYDEATITEALYVLCRRGEVYETGGTYHLAEVDT